MTTGWKLAVIYAVLVALGVPWWVPLVALTVLVLWGLTLVE
jgi:hypothetical protein